MTRHQLKQETTLSHDSSTADVSTGTTAAAAAAAAAAATATAVVVTKPSVPQTDEEDSCKLYYMQLTLTSCGSVLSSDQ